MANLELLGKKIDNIIIQICRFKVVVNTVMQIGPSIAIYGGIVFVRDPDDFKNIVYFFLFLSLLNFNSLVDLVLHVCNTWHGIIPRQNQNAWLSKRNSECDRVILWRCEVKEF
jgi:hypothetical protein